MNATPPLDPKVPAGDPLTAWERRRDSYRLVNPANRRGYTCLLYTSDAADE